MEIEENGKSSENYLNKWFIIQKLIKQETTIQDIIIKNQESNNRILKQNVYEYFTIKIKIKETIAYNQKICTADTSNTSIKYELCSDSDKSQILSELLDPIENFLFKFRSNFQYHLTLIDLVENYDEKSEEKTESLVDFFCHYFYENLLVQNPENDELMIFIYLLLEKEINQMNAPSVTSFLDNSFIGRILKSYAKKSDLKQYFTMILNELILNVDNNMDSILEIDISRIADFIKNQPKDKRYVTEKSKNLFTDHSKVLTKRIKNSSIVSNISSSNKIDDEKINSPEFHKENTTNFSSFKYDDFNDYDELLNLNDEDDTNQYKVDLTKEELTNRMNNTTNFEMKEFYSRQLSKMGNDTDVYTNKKFIHDLAQLNHNEQIIVVYKQNFEKIKDFIDNLFKSIIDNVNAIPYALRCFCKIIYILIVKKFPDISIYERNSFIAEFFFFKCIVPILTNPEYYAIVTSTVISITTRKNFFTVAKILKKINRAHFFDSKMETMFTIFNHYIIEIIPEVNNFYSKLINVNLPKVIDTLYNNKSNEEFTTFDYFKDNDDELINIQPICFNLQDVALLSKIVKQNTEVFSKDILLTKSAEKICNNESLLLPKVLIQKDTLFKDPKKFFLIFQTKSNLFKQNFLNTTIEKLTFTNEIDDIKLVYNRLKYSLKLILKNIGVINAKVYSQLDKVDDMNKFVISLNQIVQMESDHDYNKIPLSWYSIYLCTNLKNLLEEYSLDDYNYIYKDLLKEVTENLAFLNEKSNIVNTQYGINIRFLERSIANIIKELNKSKQIEKYIKIDKFIKNKIIEVCIRDNPLMKNSYDTKDLKDTSLNKISSSSKKKDSFIEIEDDSTSISVRLVGNCVHKKVSDNKTSNSSSNKSKKETKIDSHVSTIGEFIQKFGDFQEIKEDIINGDQKNKVYEGLNDYIEIIRENLINDELFINSKEETIDEILEDIENFIIRRIYKRVYPVKHLDEDKEFYSKTCNLHWITPEQSDIKKIYVNENLWAIAINCLNKMDNEKSPIEKLRCVQSAYQILNNSINFSLGKEAYSGVDDLIPILIYVIIKSKPKRIITNLNFIQALIHPNKLLARYGFLLTQIQCATEYIKSISHAQLKMSPEEFKQNMEENRSRARSNNRIVYKRESKK